MTSQSYSLAFNGLGKSSTKNSWLDILLGNRAKKLDNQNVVRYFLNLFINLFEKKTNQIFS